MRESEINSAAAIATLVLDQKLRAVVQDRFSEAIKHPVQFVTDDPKFACEGAQSYRLPSYQLPASCRIELLADMVRVAADCRRNFGAAADPVGAILQALRNVCPDATDEELRLVISAARAELYLKVNRLGGWQGHGVTLEIETWLEVAKGHIFDLDEACLNLEDWTG